MKELDENKIIDSVGENFEDDKEYNYSVKDTKRYTYDIFLQPQRKSFQILQNARQRKGKQENNEKI